MCAYKQNPPTPPGGRACSNCPFTDTPNKVRNMSLQKDNATIELISLNKYNHFAGRNRGARKI